jgi:hypothetical protein
MWYYLVRFYLTFKQKKLAYFVLVYLSETTYSYIKDRRE